VALGSVCLCPAVCGFLFSFHLHFLSMLVVPGSPVYPARCCTSLARCNSYAIIVYPALVGVLLLVASSCSIVTRAWLLRLMGTTGVNSAGWPIPNCSKWGGTQHDEAPCGRNLQRKRYRSQTMAQWRHVQQHNHDDHQKQVKPWITHHQISYAQHSSDLSLICKLGFNSSRI
jgi:hypothetical protein